MSLKDLFDKSRSYQVVSAKSMENLATDGESPANVRSKLRAAGTFVPPVDFSSASNFAVYGSAEKYYNDSVKRVYNQYPYDGSQNEKNEYFLSSSYLDHYILEKKYPRSTGYVLLSRDGWGTLVNTDGEYGAPATASYEYISLVGGPNTILRAGDNIASAFTGSHNQNNVFNLADNRGSNLAVNPASGSTVEFWFKKEAFDTNNSKKEVIFDLWNNNPATGSDSAGYGRLMVEILGTVGAAASPFRITYMSGTSGFSSEPIGSNNVSLSGVVDNLWTHYAFTFYNTGSLLQARLYVNGKLDDTVSTAGALNEVTGAMVANIGALKTNAIGRTGAALGYGKLSASLDEFRFWKARRSAEEIGKYWWTQVQGGTNTDLANTNLGVYYKFNEGITGDSITDSVVLDYSGRVSNGDWTGYGSNSRNTGSAMVSSSAAASEFRDPIIYANNPEVSTLLENLTLSGSAYDQSNNASILNSLPAWVIEQDTSGDLANLTQIIASYFDTLQLQIASFPQLKNKNYLSSSYRPFPFSDELVASSGLLSPEIFANADILSQIQSRDDNRKFELDFADLKNRIYQNIYNNIVHIYKSKGTEGAFRNLIHCYGVDENLIRPNTYPNNVTYELKDNFRSAATARNLVDFSRPPRFGATIYQFTSSNSNTVSFISGTAPNNPEYEDYVGFTLEAESVFPLRPDPCCESGSFETTFLTSSICGMHSATASAGVLTWPANDYADLRILAIRPSASSPDVRFKLTSSLSAIPDLTSSLFRGVYDNNKWNFAVRLVNKKHPLGDFVKGVSTTGSAASSGWALTPYELEFYGVNSELDIIREEFYLTASVANTNARQMLTSNKRIFAGAHRVNFVGDIIHNADMKLSAVRYWSDYVPNEAIKAHARDPEVYGTLRPARNAFLTSTALTGTYIPEIDTLALYWNFANITGSNALGQFTVEDYSSGSTEIQGRYGWLGNIVNAQHSGQGNFFELDDHKSIDRDYIYAARQVQPEISPSSDLVNILSQDDVFFTRDSRPIDYYFSIEKSMYQIISDQMINMFATIVEFNNLIGDPVNRYRQNYKAMEKLRQLFFERVGNTPDLDKFIEFYKWIDASLSVMLRQMVPASANASDGIVTLIESHVLERNKYWTKFPTVEQLNLFLEGTAGGVAGRESSPPRQRPGLDPILASAPIPYIESSHAPYWLRRASRLESPLATGDAGVDNDRETIFKSLTGSYTRDDNRPASLGIFESKAFHGGTNYFAPKKRNIVLNATYPFGPRAASGTPLNVMLINDTDVVEFQNITDVTDPNEKRKYPFKASIQREEGETYTSAMAGDLVTPFSLYSGTVNTGYNSAVVSSFKTGTIVTNLHADTFENDETPMQGPFTDQHVGGHQSRHVNINRYDAASGELDTPTTRAEAWKLLLGTEYGTDGTMMGFVGPDYPFPVGPYPYTPYPWAIRYRNVGAKRPVNIRNVNYTTSSVTIGNYNKSYEIVQVTDRGALNRYFIENDGIPLPSSPIDLKESLPKTSTLSTLLGLTHDANTVGNIFGNKPVNGVLKISNRYEILANTPTIIRTGSASKSVFVNRFSAPGGPEINTLSYLDIPTAQLSAYNALPFRNLSIRSSGSGEAGAIRVQDQLDKRRGLRTLLSLHAGRFGYDATFGSITAKEYITKPSYQKNNRNTLHRIQFAQGTDYDNGDFVTGSVYDNAYVTHPIPRGTLQYSWITASYSRSRIYGHPAMFDSIYSSSADGYTQAIEYITESEISAAGVKVDFVGLNTLINDPINLSEHILSSSTGDYRNTAVGTLSQVEMLNGLNLHRNGPYTLSTWKQIRGSQNPLVKLLRSRNFISLLDKRKSSYPLTATSASLTVRPRYGRLEDFYEAPVVSRFLPLIQGVTIRDSSTPNITVQSAYANNLSAFNHVALNNFYNVAQDAPQNYDRISSLYLSDDPTSPITSFNYLVYTEGVYPASINAFSSSIRGRKDYSNTFWRNHRGSRTQTSVTDPLNLSGPAIAQSMWSLDADQDFLTREINNRVTSTGSAGSLQNDYSQVHGGTIVNITASVLYSRRHTIDNIKSVASPVGAIEIHATGANRNPWETFTHNSGVNGYKQLLAGQALWECGNQSSKNPWYNNYEEYAAQMRLLGKDYSIIPEFRISDHIEYYVNTKRGDFLADNPNLLQMTGGLADRDTSSESSFYTTYTNSDFMKFFEVVRKDHQEIAEPSEIGLRCSALLKFLPYNGFYPAERTVQLAQQFSSSYGKYVKLTSSLASPATASHIGMRAFMAPFFAPGIMYNTIKSGIAVDYPMFSASMETHDIDAPLTENNTILISGSSGIGRFHYRIPFEALVEPGKYIADKDMVDLEPNPSCSINVTASWGGRGDNLYKMMSNNFFAEVPEFFLPQGQFATLRSRPEGEFDIAEPGRQYAARVKVFKSLNQTSWRTGSLGYRNPFIPLNADNTSGNPLFETFTMYSRPSAFGPPCGAGKFVDYNYSACSGLNMPFTPPYYNGEAWVDIIFTAPSGTVNLTSIFDPANLSATYTRIGDDWENSPKMASGTIFHGNNVEFNSVQMDSSFNLFGKAQIKDLRYDIESGEPTQASDSTENVWVIQPKFETPMLNFSGSSVTYPTYGSASVAYGMWHQRGELPDDPSKGVFMQIGDIPDNYIKYALNGNPDATGSLVDLVGFGTSPIRLGEVANTKTIREAIVAVPFTQREGTKHFFPISTSVLRDAVKASNGKAPASDETPNPSIVDMVSKMQRYVFPPTMDFITNPDRVDPFAMYIFEFTHTLSQEDLSDIWQNISPRIGLAFDTESQTFLDGAGVTSEQIVREVSISHPILAGELLSSVDSDIQWMVFKVKQKAQTNYFNKVVKDQVNPVANFNRSVALDIGRDDSSRSSDLPYSYNWPYDFFSLVELIKIDAAVTISPNDSDPSTE